MIKDLETINTLIPHKVINLSSQRVQIYTQQTQLIREFTPTGEVATARDFREIKPLPTIRLWNRVGYIPVEQQGKQLARNNPVLEDEQDAPLPLVYRVPVVTPKFLTPPNRGLSGTIQNLPRAPRPESVWIPIWYLVVPSVAHLAGQANRADVITWDESTLLFHEDGQIGIQRFVQW